MTNLTTIPTLQRTNAPTRTTRTTRTTTETAADSTAAAPEPTAPRGRLRSSEEAAPSEPDPAATRSQSASPRLFDGDGKMKA